MRIEAPVLATKRKRSEIALVIEADSSPRHAKNIKKYPKRY